MRERLARSFYARPTLTVAKDLLGKYLVRRLPDGQVRAGRIVETEAYIGPRDKASHAFGGKVTERNRAEWMVGGHVYIYLVYGMYWQFNISTGKEGSPECVLVRALEPAPPLTPPPRGGETNRSPLLSLRARVPSGPVAKEGIKGWFGSAHNQKIVNLANGPGKLCRWMSLDKSFYSEDLTKSRRLWVEARGIRVPRTKIVAGPRVGIDYAGAYWAAMPWRFYIKGNAAVSRPHL